MKKIIAILLICFVANTAIKAQYVNIPDTNFGSFLLAKYPSCLYKDASNLYWMDTTCSGVVNADSIVYIGWPLTSIQKIQNLQGVQYFTNLKYLDVTKNLLSSIPTLPKNLQYLNTSFNSNVVSLPTLPNTLTWLSCYQNALTSLPQLPNNLQTLDVLGNNLSALPTLPNSLLYLRTYGNPLLNCLPLLPPNLVSLYTDVLCIPNKPATLVASPGGSALPPICNATNNPKNCPILSNPYVNIPDTNFGSFLLAKYPSCLYKDASNLYWMDTTCSGVVNADSILYNGFPLADSQKIQNLQGVQYFSNLKYLDVTKNLLSSIPTLPKTLQYLNTNFNSNIVSLPVLPNALISLNCYQNALTSLPQLPNNLQSIDVLGNNLSALPTLPNSLKYLRTYGNPLLTCLPLLPSNITDLYTDVPCIPNKPATLVNAGNTAPPPVCNATNNPNNCTVYPANYVNIPDSSFGKFLLAKYPSCLYKDNANKYWMDTTCSGVVSATFLDCSSVSQINSIQGVQYFKHLNTLYCHYTSIDSLPQLPNTLQYLSCRNTNIKHVKNLPSSLLVLNVNYTFLQTISGPLPPALNTLVMGDNNVSVLPDLPKSLTLLSCRNNPLTCLPKLPNSLTSLVLGWTQITCLPNQPQNCVVTDGFTNAVMYVPVCNPTNNANQCHIYPNVSGKVFTDNNSNNAKDANEFYRPFVKFSLDGGQQYTYSNLTGSYAISIDSFGSYTLKVTPPPYFKAVPDSINISFTAGSTSLILPDIALQPIAAIDSFGIKITKLNRPRPGFGLAYNISYANMGTVSSVNDNIIPINYDTSKLHFDSATVVTTTSGIYNAPLEVNAGKLVAGQGGSFNIYFTVKPTVAIGDTIRTVADLIYSSTKIYDVDSAIVVGSFDPNDKQATPTLTPQQVSNGEYIDYVIRFQNTGNANATNIVISDTLSNLLQFSNIQIVSSSHNSNISYSVGNGVIYFQFLNINLPYASANEPLSQGFVRFRVKALPTLAIGAIVPNTASIYFDYNTPIVTNTATTQVKATIVPVRIISYAIAANNNREIRNDWRVGAEVNTSHYIIQRSMDGKDFLSVGEVAARGLNSYSFTDKVSNDILQNTVYYRLKIFDKDGMFTYSDVKQITRNEKQETISMYPNPARDFVNIDCSDASNLLIMDALGKTIIQYNNITKHQTINTKQFTKGVYMVKLIMNNGAIRTSKLIIE